MALPLLFLLSAAQIGAQGQSSAESQRQAIKENVYNAKTDWEKKQWDIRRQQKADEEARRSAIARQFDTKGIMLNNPDEGFAPSETPPGYNGAIGNYNTLAGVLNAASALPWDKLNKKKKEGL